MNSSNIKTASAKPITNSILMVHETLLSVLKAYFKTDKNISQHFSPPQQLEQSKIIPPK